jgi:pilus assembly protein Flp/PilA
MQLAGQKAVRKRNHEGVGRTTMAHYQFLSAWLRSRVQSERGASLVEYALLVALIAVVCIAAVSFLGGEVEDEFSRVGNSLN